MTKINEWQLVNITSDENEMIETIEFYYELLTLAQKYKKVVRVRTTDMTGHMDFTIGYITRIMGNYDEVHMISIDGEKKEIIGDFHFLEEVWMEQ